MEIEQEGDPNVLASAKTEGMERIQTALTKARARQEKPRQETPQHGAPQHIGAVPSAARTGEPGTGDVPAAARAHMETALPKPQLPRPAVNTVTASVWDKLPAGRPDPWRVEQGRLVTVGRSNPAHVAFDILRTKVLHLLRQNSWSTVLVTSPTARCGKTVVSLNLAFSLANQKDCRTALVDLDLRRPQVAEVLGVKSPPSMEDFLRGRTGVEDTFSRYGKNIAIASNKRPVRMAAELLQSPEAGQVMKDIKRKLEPDVTVFDLPPMLANDDVMSFLPNVDCAILVVAAEQSTMSEIDLCERELSDKTNLLGTVLNKCRYAPEKYGY